MKYLLLLLLLVPLAGCSTMSVISPEMMEAAGVDVDSGVSTIADASVLKELAVHKTLQNRDQMIKDATLVSGFKSKWVTCKRTVYYPGMARPITVVEPCQDISFVPMPVFNQKLPTSPSVHPGYKMVENITTTIVKGTLVGYGLYTTADVLKEAFARAGDDYDYSDSDFDQSFNGGEGNTNTGVPESPEVEVDLEEGE